MLNVKAVKLTEFSLTYIFPYNIIKANISIKEVT